jgi:hemin uptake protein HemP
MTDSGYGQGGDQKASTNLQETVAVDTTNLFQGNRELKIIHQGVPYTLRITSNNKLILTK